MLIWILNKHFKSRVSGTHIKFDYLEFMSLVMSRIRAVYQNAKMAMVTSLGHNPSGSDLSS